MKRSSFISPARALVAFLALLMLAMQPAAQSPLPLDEPPRAFANQWVVTLAPGTDPYAVAGRMGVIVERAIGADTYVFRAGNTLDAITMETAQALDAGLTRSPEVLHIEQQELQYRYPRGVEDTITDPLFPNQWHLNNTGQGGGTAGNDANIFAAWNAGYTGSGVVVSSVDNGLWHTNPDIAGNYLPSASWDFVGNDSDPSGGGHGTSVGGVMAADNDGGACGVGVAFNAQLSGLRLFSGASTDANEASALSYQRQVIDIYNNSWGPSDSGTVLGGPGPLTSEALADSIANGRGGLGSIYVWAGGNGAEYGDNVNADGYANSRYTIAVAASTNYGTRASYSEYGSPLLVNAPSHGGSAAITTTAYGSTGCNTSFGGTSSAAPLVAGVVALMLEANPSLTWRDVQHILVQTAEKNAPGDSGWFNNGAGLHFNHAFGFGRVDAGAAVALAQSWTTVGPEQTIDSGTLSVNQNFPGGSGFVTRTFEVTDALTLESVDVVFNATHPSRGKVYIELISPSGTTSVLMPGRPFDFNSNYNNWRFNTVANWGESAVGTWTLRAKDISDLGQGSFNSWRLYLHGSLGTSTFITQNPASRDVLFDEPVTLSVGAVGGSPISYQWYEGASGDTSTPVGTDSPTFTTPALHANTQYWVRATGTANSADSSTAVLTVVNSVGMLNDPAFDTKKPPIWTFSSSEGKVACNKQYVSASCAARLRNTLPGKATMHQDVKLNTYPWSLRIDDTLDVVLQVKAMPGAKAKVQIIVKFADGTKSKTAQKFTADGVWGTVTHSVTLQRTDITTVRARVIDKTVTPNVNVWMDDAQLWHGRTASARGGGDVLPPPAAPEGFRGTN